MKIQGLLRKTSPRAHRRADLGAYIQRWLMRSALLLVCAVSVVSAHAGTIIGGSNLLDDAGLDLLEGWLGEGELDVTNIFTKWEGANAGDFHAAVDGRGRTFSLIEVLDSNGNFLHLIGGYNPQSWHSMDTYNLTPNDSDRTAFIFNLTSEIIHRQRHSDWPGSDHHFDPGQNQTFGYSLAGPIFGGGYDIAVDGSLMFGQVSTVSYGDSDSDFGFANSILGADSTPYQVSLGDIEVFTIASAAPAVVPIPAPAALGLLGMGLIACKRRFRKDSSQA